MLADLLDPSLVPEPRSPELPMARRYAEAEALRRSRNQPVARLDPDRFAVCIATARQAKTDALEALEALEELEELEEGAGR